MAEPIPVAPHLSERSGLAYHEYGDPAGDRIVVFHHGWPAAGCQGSLFDAAAKELGVRILAPNRPGIAGSAPDHGRGFGACLVEVTYGRFCTSPTAG